MKKIIALVLLGLISGFVYRSFDLKDIFRSIDFNNNDSSRRDLFFLKEKIKDKDIVLLGEGLHFYKTDGESKLSVIKFLHEEMDFDLLLMEYSFYDFYNLNNSLGTNSNFEDTVLKYSRYLPKHILDVIEYVNEQKLNGRSIELGGVDIDMNYYGFTRNPINFLIKNDTKYLSDNGVRDFYYLLQTPLSKLDKLTEVENQKIIEKIQKKSYAKSLFSNDSLNQLWLQIFKNLEVELFYDLLRAKRVNINVNKEPTRMFLDIDNSKKRDSMMFQNFNYLKKLYPNKKIIVYTSSFHTRKSVNPFKNKRKIGNNTKPLGKYISDMYKNTFHIAWIYRYVGDIEKKNKKFLTRSKYSLEEYMFKNKFGSGFIDLHDLALNGDSIFTMYPIWNFRTKGNWSEAFDAVIYMDTALAMTKYFNYGIYNDSLEQPYFPINR